MKLIKITLFTFWMGLLLWLSIQLLFAQTSMVVLTRNGQPVYHFNTSQPVMIPEHIQEKNQEFRAVWVATVFNLNMPQHTSESQYKAAFASLIADVKEKNMNAIFFQVRPMNDAFYASDLAPFSRYLTGVEGQDPGWDVMAYMVDYAKSQGVEFHAWLNPYRVGTSALEKSAFINTLSTANFGRKNPELVVQGTISNGQYPYILNPGEPEVKTYIRSVVVELMERYNVDGIHFDDYFYPYSGISSDQLTYQTYAPVGMNISDWRRENINDVIRGVKEDVDAHNLTQAKDVRFGVSPFGIWRSGGTEGSNTSTSALQSFTTQFADSRKWVQEGWVHYICPQVYWNFGHALAPYADVVDWWASVTRGTGVDLIIGHSPYHASINNWLNDELVMQLKYNQKHPEIKGSSMYSFAYIEHVHLNEVRSQSWTQVPTSTWESSQIAMPTINLTGTFDSGKYRSNVTVTLSSSYDVFYKINEGNWIPYLEPFVIDTQGITAIYAKAVTQTEESLIASTTLHIEKVNMVVPQIVLNGDQIGGDYVAGTELVLLASEPIFYAINHGSIGSWQPYIGPIPLTGLGNHFIQAKTINSEGIESSMITRLVKIVPACYPEPTLTLEGEGNPPYYQNATLHLTGSTAMSYRINGGSWIPYESPIEFDQDGHYLFEYRNEDACQTVYQESFEIIQAIGDPIIEIEGTSDGWYFTEVTTVTLIPADPLDTLYYRIHNGSSWTPWLIYQEPLVFEVNATYTLEFYAKDRALNQTETFEQRIRLNIPPSDDNQWIYRDGQIVRYYQSNVPVELPIHYREKDQEIRAIWVATVFNIDLASYVNEADYKSRIILMLDRIKALHFNTIFFQVRSMNDAFYPSSYAPISRFLTGIEGGDPGWDVLEFIIQEAHARGLELHAWLNPYRVTASSTLSKEEQLSLLHETNFARQNPSLVMVDNNGALILNPGEPQVRAYLKNVIEELMMNYAIDGIHFDDYFYSYSGMSTTQDAHTYNRTKQALQSLADWRRDNVNTLVRDVFHLVEHYNQSQQRFMKFGISPFGIWKSGGPDGSNTSTSTLSSYSAQFADSKKWVEEGWLHYIIPQLYWEFSHRLAPFADLVDWWVDVTKDTSVKLIIGQGFYRYADGSWKDADEIIEQLRYMSQYPSIYGSSFFSYRTLNSSHALVVQALARIQESYWTQTVDFAWETSVVPPVPHECLPGETFQDGVCVPIPPQCHDDELLVDGVCVPKEPVCGTNETLIDGVCVPEKEEPLDERGLLYVILGVGATLVLGMAFIVIRKLRFRV